MTSMTMDDIDDIDVVCRIGEPADEERHLERAHAGEPCQTPRWDGCARSRSLSRWHSALACLQ